MPNITTNHAITYTYLKKELVKELHHTSTAPGLLFVSRLIESLNRPLYRRIFADVTVYIFPH